MNLTPDVVTVWQEEVIIPTYEVGAPDKNPMFFENRVYQGSSGVVYPNPVIEKIYDEKIDKTYRALFLENKYLRVMVLPELGGRVQMAYDKIKERHFIYYNQVIKPALVGLTGPWISGGIEFNWPQHHRPSTFEPIDYKMDNNADGSKTIWVNEVEKMFGTKGMAGFTLHPDKAYLEIKVQLYNRTPFPQTFLWWANPAVKVNDEYQSVFPPDVNAVFDHGKRDVSAFPMATGTYYKVDYSPGTDISRYKNIPVPTSYMAINSTYDFMGGYEHDTEAGVLHVASHYVSPGKKQWTWGHGDFGVAWDRNLTDEDGPYIELMAGVFTDNQPDFSWLMPYEEKSFTQYFLPYRELGVVKNATKDILLAALCENGKYLIKVQVTSSLKNACICLVYKNEKIFEETVNLVVENIYVKELDVDKAAVESDFVLSILNDKGAEILSYKPDLTPKELPEAAKAALQPTDVENTEQLFLTAQHLEQYRHATYSPVPYYEEALHRDPKDIRANNGLGLWYLRRGKFKKAETYFKQAIATMTCRNPNPYDGEPFYNLGLSLVYQQKYTEAYTAFYKAAWNSAWQDVAYFALAQLDVQQGNYNQALAHINDALDRNARNGRAYTLKSVILRKMECIAEADLVCAEGLKRDTFNIGLYFEKYLLAGETDTLTALKTLSRQTANNLLAYAADYAECHLYTEAVALLSNLPQTANTPLVYYHRAYYYHKMGLESEAKIALNTAATLSPYLCMPNKINDIAVLTYATENNVTDAKAPYYLGCLWYDKRQYADAIAMWELSAKRDGNFATVWRNLGIAAFNKQQNPAKALTYFEKAFVLDNTDARVLMELDQLYKRLQKAPSERLQFLEQHLETVLKRDDLFLERVALYNILGNYTKAYQLLMSRKFHPWEGGEGKVAGQYVTSLVEMAKAHIGQKDNETALVKLKQATVYPHNLGEGKLFGAQENDIYYWMGVAAQNLGNEEEAKNYFEIAATGKDELLAAMFYNDQQPDKVFYKGLALRKLGQQSAADKLFQSFVTYSESNIDKEVKLDYFAVSLPDLLIFDDDLNLRNKTHCHYIAGLGYLGLNHPSAMEAFEKAQAMDVANIGIKTHLLLAKQKMQGVEI